MTHVLINRFSTPRALTLGTPNLNERSREFTRSKQSVTMTLTMDTRNWNVIEAELEHREKTRLLRMSAAEWKAEGNRIIRAWSGRDIRECLDYLNRMELERERYAEEMAHPTPTEVPRPQREFDIDYAAWKDVVEEPWKYGDSALQAWVALDAKLAAGPGRWRVGAYWVEKQAEVDAAIDALSAPWRALYSQIAKEAAVAGDRAWIRRDVKRHAARFRAEVAAWHAKRAAAATRIAAAVRGHQVRTQAPYLHCCMCLSHRISPLRTPVGMMCRSCAVEDEVFPMGDGWAWARKEFTE